MTHEVGWSVETPFSIPIYSTEPFPDYETDISKFGVSSYIQIKRLGDTTPYSPEQRHLANDPEGYDSPDLLDVEFGMFLIPDKKSFSEINLCPNIQSEKTIDPVFTDNGWADWTVSNNYTIEGCSWNPTNPSQILSSDSCEDSYSIKHGATFNEKCLRQMPPSRKFTFTIKNQANNKWSWDPEASNSTKNAPEYLMDFSQIYYFDHDASLMDVERKIAENAALGGDVDSQGNLHVFFGSYDNAVR